MGHGTQIETSPSPKAVHLEKESIIHYHFFFFLLNKGAVIIQYSFLQHYFFQGGKRLVEVCTLVKFFFPVRQS